MQLSNSATSIRCWPLLFLPGVLSIFGFAGCATTPATPDFEPIIARFYLEAGPATTAGTQVRLPISGMEMVVGRAPVLSELDLVNVELAEVELGLCLYFEFTPRAARDLQRMTAANQGQRLLLTLNDLPVGARHIDQPFVHGYFFMFVEIDDEELPEVAFNLKRTTREIQNRIAREQGRN